MNNLSRDFNNCATFQLLLHTRVMNHPCTKLFQSEGSTTTICGQPKHRYLGDLLHERSCTQIEP